MDVKISDVMYASTEEINEINKILGKSEKEIKQDVAHLKEWLIKQPHLPQNIDDKFFIKILRLNKHSLEKSKKKIDMFFTIRTITPDIYNHRNMLAREMRTHMDSVMLCPLPKLTNDLNRILIFKCLSDNSDNFNFDLHVNFIFAMADFRLMNDEFSREIYVCDMSTFSLGHVLKHNLVTMKKCFTIVQKAYSDRIKAVHIINLPNYCNSLISFGNTLLNDKMSKRIYVHQNLESLYKEISKEILPKEFGGNEKSLTDLNRNWRQLLENHNDWLLQMANKKSIEKLRNGDPVDADLFGSIHGSFRQLNLD